MKANMKAKLLGLINTLEWDKEFLQFKETVERENGLPLADASLLALLREMNEKGQRRAAQILQLSFAQRKSRKWPEMLFIKSIQPLLKQANADLDTKRRLILAAVQEVQPVLEHANDDLGTLMEQQAQLIKQFGQWHFYWALYFHPGRISAPEDWQSCWEKLQEAASGWKHAAAIEPKNHPPLEEKSVHPQEEEKDYSSRKIAALEKKLAKEAALRQAQSLELEQSKKLLLQKEREARLAENKLSAQAQQLEYNERKLDEALRRLKVEEQIKDKIESRGKAEKEKLREQLQTREREADKLNRQAAQLANENRRLRTEAAELNRLLHDPNEAMLRLISLLEGEIRQLSRRLTAEGPPGKEDRGRMRVILDVLDALDVYRRQEQAAPPELPPEVEAQAQPSPPAASSEAAVGPPDPANDVSTGTFYRRNHGGYIQLESGEVFNITESMVNYHQLEHEAEVQCKPYTQDNGSIFYQIELLFQGDDLYAPIRQYAGYVQLGPHYTWYCVDLNNPDHRYPLHRRDVEIQQPEDGMPCTFNVSEESEFARLSRVYRHFAKAESSSELRRIQTARARINDTPAVKPQPFLTGCTIAIIGGQRKWFEEVVTESGAALVHDTGDRPERIAHDLRRSQALFLLITSTSHRATWEGIELAKEHGIPHFTIQGSKSNLRKLLWDNQAAIRAGLGQ